MRNVPFCYCYEKRMLEYRSMIAATLFMQRGHWTFGICYHGLHSVDALIAYACFVLLRSAVQRSD